MKEVITKLKLTCVSALTRQVLLALDNARLQIEAQTQKFSGTQLPPLREESTAVAERFGDFDPRRMAILLIGGDKTGDDRWYEVHVTIADQLYDEHLEQLRLEGKS